MYSLLENSWVVGIGGGLVSGVIVYLITKFIDNKKGKKQYWSAVNQANKEVIITLQPYVTDNGLPQEVLMSAIIASVARKHHISPLDLYAPKVFAEELIRDIINNIYVTKEQKQEYTIALIEYIKELDDSKMESLNDNGLTADQTNKKASSVAALVAGVVSAFATLFASYSLTTESESMVYIPPSFIILLILFLLIIIAGMSYVMLQKNMKLKKINNEKHDS